MTEQRVAVVTGAAQGIGRRIAEVLAADGWSLVLADVQPLDDAARALTSAGATVEGVICDVAAEDDVVALAARIRERHGRVDAVVNNAGIASIEPAETTSLERWRRVIEVNLTGPFLVCRELGALMLEARTGSIVNVASVAGIVGVADRVAYNASKHGLIGLTRTLAAEWGARGVRVNAVCPGWVKTEMDVAAQAAGLYTDDDIVERVPMGRFASPTDVANAVAFLADPDRSAFVNGVALPVDGGWTGDGSWGALRASKRRPATWPDGAAVSSTRG